MIDIPAGTDIEELKVIIGSVDDGARKIIFNSKYPNGLYHDAEDGRLGGVNFTTDFADGAVAGEVNTVIIVQMDDCAVDNRMTGGITVRLNGEELTPEPSWEAEHPEFERQEEYVSYKTVKIGEVEMFAENLRTTTCADGTPIPPGTYRVEDDRSVKYSALAVDACELCPTGWRVMNREDLDLLQEMSLDREEIQERANITREGIGGSYLILADTRMYYGDFPNGETIRQAYFDAVRCVKKRTEITYDPIESDLVGHWDFSGSSPLRDLTGNFSDLELKNNAQIQNDALDVNSGTWAQAVGYEGETIREKSLVAWVRLDNLDVRTGSVLTLDLTDGNQFDGIVYAEREPRKWMSGSSGFDRTENPQPGFQEVSTGELVMMAITYADVGGETNVKIYRNGQLVGDYTKGSIREYGSTAEVLFGARHTNGQNQYGSVDARIEEARIYNGVLTENNVQGLYAGVENETPLLDGKVFRIKTNYDNGSSVYLGIDETAAGVRGASAGIWDRTASKTQEWRFEQVEEGVYHIISNIEGTNNKYLDADLANIGTNGTVIHLWSGHGGKNQQWQVIENENGTYRLQSMEPRAGNRSVDLSLGGNVGKNGGKVHLWSNHTGANQQWILEEVR
ncbi:MAG: RICIN domain-containing protein [Lewinella sp.]|uniref:RICIN domain-containing protein n=1 Tax=Lewinella sp. TaxID=2004506 RepID=UPI003D6AEA26